MIDALILALVLLAAALVLHSSLADDFAFGLLLAGPSVAIFYGLSEFFGTPNPVPDPSDLSDRWWDTILAGGSSSRRELHISGTRMAGTHSHNTEGVAKTTDEERPGLRYHR